VQLLGLFDVNIEITLQAINFRSYYIQLLSSMSAQHKCTGQWYAQCRS